MLDLRFFFSVEPSALAEDPSEWQHESHCSLLLGPPRCGKTSLLFQYAYNYAKSHAQRPNAVFFLCMKQKICNQLPLFPAAIEPDMTVLERIQMKFSLSLSLPLLSSSPLSFSLVSSFLSFFRFFLFCSLFLVVSFFQFRRYIDNEAELRAFCASLHLMQPPPELLAIDDLSSFFVEGATSAATLAKTAAFVREAANYLSSVNSTNPFSTVLVSDTLNLEAMPSHSRATAFYQRWFPLVLLLQGQHNPFSLSLLDGASSSSSSSTTTTKATFELSGDRFRLLSFSSSSSHQQPSSSSSPSLIP
ncbi:ATPase domain-containing protein [Balamuthia mandrillaris]